VISRWLVWLVFALIMGPPFSGSVLWGLYGPNMIEHANGTYEKQFAHSTMIAQLNEHWGLAFSVVVCVVSMVALVGLVASIWQGWFVHWITFDCFLFSRKIIAFLAALYAIICAWRLYENVAMKTLDQKFVPELIFYSIFWVLAPPIWFFVEYFAIESDWIALPVNKDRTEYLKTIKNYADYASKIWAGVLALLGALIALKH
jgi:hypothetical protein